MHKEKAIYLMKAAKAIVADVWIETDIDKVGDVLCAINEAVNAIEEFQIELEEKQTDA